MSESQEISAVASDADVQYNVEQIINLYVLWILSVLNWC